MKLKKAGIEPTEAGVKKYLELLVNPALDRQIDVLIMELGDDQHETRERASQRLTTLGPAGIQKLEAAGKGPDVERALRAKFILTELQSSEHAPLLWALELVREKQLAVGLPLLGKIREMTTSPPLQEAAAQAMLAIVEDADRPNVEKILKDGDMGVRNIGRRLLARLDGTDESPLLEGVFDAVKLQPGSVAGGGPNLVQGWEFKPKSDMFVTHLGVYDDAKNGLKSPHEVAIWEIEANAGPVVGKTVPAGEAAELTGAFRLVAVERVVLKSGRHYAIVAHYPDPNDSSVSLVNPSGLTVDFDSHLEAIGRRYSFPHAAMAFPVHRQEGVKHATLGPTFRFEVVDEP